MNGSARLWRATEALGWRTPCLLKHADVTQLSCHQIRQPHTRERTRVRSQLTDPARLARLQVSKEAGDIVVGDQASESNGRLSA